MRFVEFLKILNRTEASVFFNRTDFGKSEPDLALSDYAIYLKVLAYVGGCTLNKDFAKTFLQRRSSAVQLVDVTQIIEATFFSPLKTLTKQKLFNRFIEQPLLLSAFKEINLFAIVLSRKS